MIRQIVYPKLGEHRGSRRIWLDGERLAEAGLKPGAMYRRTIDEVNKTIRIELIDGAQEDVRSDDILKVSKKQKYGREIPVIDVRNKTLNKLFDDTLDRVKAVVTDGRIEISIHRDDLKRMERLKRIKARVRAGLPLRMGSLFTGLGVMDTAVQKGLRKRGLKTEQTFVIEKDANFLEAYVRNNPDRTKNTLIILGGVEDVDGCVPETDMLVAGLPCLGVSRQGKTKRGLKYAEDHPDVGHLFVPVLGIVRDSNPVMVQFEQVAEFRFTETASVLRKMMDLMGYDMHEIVLDGNEMGALEKRQRVVMLAVTKGIKFSWDGLQPVREKEARLGDVLDVYPEDHEIWRSYDYLKAKAIRDAAKGNGFKEHICTMDSTYCHTILGGYSKVRSGELRIAHPTNPELSRQVTPIEHARLKTVCPDLIDGLSKTKAHQLLGQSVISVMFEATGYHDGLALLRYAGVEPRTVMAPQAAQLALAIA